MSTLPDFMHVADNLTDAAVALESTVISHGLPYPHNIQLALRLEEIVRAGGATAGHHRHHRRQDRRRAGPRPDRAPGDGAGRPQGEPPRSADRGGAQAGRRDHRRDHLVGRAPGRHPGLRHGRDRGSASDRRPGDRSQGTGDRGRSRQSGATAFSFQQPVLPAFLSTDISADLPELAQTPILVVCAGAKAILDLPATLEWLETHGVTVVGYGTDRFPAFYNRDSGLPVDVRADTPAEVAALFRAQRALGLPCGMLVTVPIPAEFEPPADQMEAAIAQALAEAEAQGIKGKAMTPFLLARVSALTGEASLRANLALLENNARVAAEIAVALGQGNK